MFSVFLDLELVQNKVSFTSYKEIIKIKSFICDIFNIFWDYQNLPSITPAIDRNQSKIIEKITKISQSNAQSCCIFVELR